MGPSKSCTVVIPRAVTMVCQLLQIFVVTRQNQGNYKLPQKYEL